MKHRYRPHALLAYTLTVAASGLLTIYASRSYSLATSINHSVHQRLSLYGPSPTPEIARSVTMAETHRIRSRFHQKVDEGFIDTLCNALKQLSTRSDDQTIEAAYVLANGLEGAAEHLSDSQKERVKNASSDLLQSTHPQIKDLFLRVYDLIPDESLEKSLRAQIDSFDPDFREQVRARLQAHQHGQTQEGHS